MAINTKNKRRSAQGFRGPVPDNSPPNAGDRRQIAGLYRFGDWEAATGTATRTTFDTTTVTTEELAERMKALIDDLLSTAVIT